MTIQSRVLSFIHRPDRAGFESLALEVFRYQFETVAAYREHCRALGINPAAVGSVDDVPLVSTVAFKYAMLAPADGAGNPHARIFLTSGTTVGAERRGRHVVADPEIYRGSALAHLRRMLFPDGLKLRVLALHPTGAAMPESSLAAMLGWCIDEFGTTPSICVADRRGIDCSRAIEFLARAQIDRAPVCILGTTAAFALLAATIAEQRVTIRLAPGSRLMDTGGAKGQAEPLDAASVAELAEARLGIAADFVINEYGMTELCSQMYDATGFNSDGGAKPGARVKIAPPWLRVRAVDPATLKGVPDGATGMLAFFDLANVNSVSAVLSEDLGVVEGDRIRLMGRAGLAQARGCALGIDQFRAQARVEDAG